MSECPQCTSMCIYETRDMECNHNGGHSSCAWPTPQYECGTNGVSPDATCHAHMCPLTYSYTPVVHLDLCLCVCTAHSLCAHTGMSSASRRCDALSRAAGDGLWFGRFAGGGGGGVECRCAVVRLNPKERCWSWPPFGTLLRPRACASFLSPSATRNTMHVTVLCMLIMHAAALRRPPHSRLRPCSDLCGEVWASARSVALALAEASARLETERPVCSTSPLAAGSPAEMPEQQAQRTPAVSWYV